MQKIIEVASGFDLYHVGYTVDGDAIIGHAYFVQIELDNGQRFAHTAVFKSSTLEYCDETGEPYGVHEFDECQAKAEKLANRIRSHLAHGGKLDQACWIECDPAYGSEAYQELDSTGFFKNREKELDGAF